MMRTQHSSALKSRTALKSRPPVKNRPILENLPKLGVGINYHWDFAELIAHNPQLIQFIEVSPDMLCEEIFAQEHRSLRFDARKLADLQQLAQQFPVVVHGLGLSIGSARGWNQGYVQMLDQYAQQQFFHWHSEHLGFTLAQGDKAGDDHAGLLLPLPFTHEALALLEPRIQHMCERYDVPFLIENTTYYLPDFTGNDWNEIEFLNQLLNNTDCGLLLDLYNFYCNAVNFGFDPAEALLQLQLDRVVEIHIAGGITHEGFLLDVHSDLVPEAVWNLLELIVPHTPNLCAITYELLEFSLPMLGEEKILSQLALAQSA